MRDHTSITMTSTSAFESCMMMRRRGLWMVRSRLSNISSTSVNHSSCRVGLSRWMSASSSASSSQAQEPQQGDEPPQQQQQRKQKQQSPSRARTLLGALALLATGATAYATCAEPISHWWQLREAQRKHAELVASSSNGSWTSKAPIPADAPAWLHELARHPRYHYRDAREVMNPHGHLIYDSLYASQGGVTEYYHFVEQRGDVLDVKEALVREALTHEPEFERVPGAMETPYRMKKAHSASSSSSSSSPAIDSIQSAHKSAPAPSSSSSSSSTTATAAAVVVVPAQPTSPVSAMPEVRAVYRLGPRLCGHKHIIHGGMIATLLDDVSGACAFLNVGPGVFTANLNVNYLRPLPADQYVVVHAHVEKRERRKTYVRVQIENGKGDVVFAQGTALFVLPKWVQALGGGGINPTAVAQAAKTLSAPVVRDERVAA